MPTTSISLLERLRQPNEQQTWERFVDPYTPLLYHWARHGGLQDQDAADLVQDVFATLVQKMPAFIYDSQKGFRSWLRTVTLNTWRNNCKRRGRQPLPPDNGALAEVATSDDADPFWEAEYRRHLTEQALKVMQAEFQPATWKACWEFIVEGRSAADIAAQLGISENAV